MSAVETPSPQPTVDLTDADTGGWVPPDTFGARLALIRQYRGWNIAQAARACGLSEQSWSNWEGNRSPRYFERTARAIADGSGCDYVWLVAGDGVRTGSR